MSLPAAARSRETSAWTAFAASAGPSSGHRSAASRSTGTASPPAMASRISRLRSRAPPTGSDRPSASRTSSGPSMPMRTFPVLGVVTMSLRHLQRPGFHLNGYAR